MLQNFYCGNPELQTHEAVRWGAFAAQNMMLSAKALGYDSCPMIGFDADAVGRIIQLPDDHIIVMMLALGKAKKAAGPRGGPLAMEEVLVEDHF
mgnify:CR=1 FL=1